MRLLGLCLLLSLSAASVADAQASAAPAPASRPNPQTTVKRADDYAPPTVVLVMEAPGGLRAASAVRKALNEAGWAVVSLPEAKRRSLVPDALLTIGAGNLQTVQVVYWERDGASDALSAPSPATAEQQHAVLVALSSALIERHRFASAPMAREILARTRLFDDARTPGAVYAMLGQGGRLHPRTNVFLRYEDF